MARKPGASHTRAVQAEEASGPPRKNRMLHFLAPFPVFPITGFPLGLVEISAAVIRLFWASSVFSTWANITGSGSSSRI
jgi:hypothetical protein